MNNHEMKILCEKMVLGDVDDDDDGDDYCNDNDDDDIEDTMMTKMMINQHV